MRGSRKRESERLKIFNGREREREERERRIDSQSIEMCISLSHSINDNESCADLLLERMDNVSINGADKSGR